MRTQPVSLTVLGLLALAAAACAPSTGRPGQPGTGASRPAVQRTLVIAVRGELPSVASRPLVPVTGALAPPTTLFNAALDYMDERGNPHPYLAQDLPR